MSETYCTAALNYTVGESTQSVATPIRNGRLVRKSLHLAEQGFQLLHHESAIDDWNDQQGLTTIYVEEMRALAIELTDADIALVYEPLSRDPQTARSVADYAPILFVHSDFTDDYGPMVRDATRPYAQFLEPLLKANDVARSELFEARLEMVQFWRNVGPVAPDFPLALCDATTVPRDRLIPFTVSEYGGQPLAFETFAVAPPLADEYRWYTFPALGDDEVIALRTYDSERSANGQPFWTPHSAFRDPFAAEQDRRASVEVRALCLHF